MDDNLAPVPIGRDPLAIIEELDDKAIIAAVQGKIAETWVYHFGSGRNEVWGLSSKGVDAAAREMAKRGEVLRITDCRIVFENDEEARFVAHAARYAVSGDGQEILLDTQMRAKRQSKFQKINRWENGQKVGFDVVPDEFWYEKGMAKATRNAKAALLADEVRAHIIAESQAQAGRVQNVENGGGHDQRARGAPRGQVRQAPPPEPPDTDGDPGPSEPQSRSAPPKAPAGEETIEQLQRRASAAYSAWAKRQPKVAQSFVEHQLPHASNRGALRIAQLTAADCYLILHEAGA